MHIKPLVAIVLVGVLAATVTAGPIHTNAKSFELAADGSTLTVEGTWHRLSARPTFDIPEANSFRIECSRRDRVCREYCAVLIQPSAEGAAYHVKDTLLFILAQEFVVQHWDTGTITAKAEPRAADIFLRISLTNHTAERTLQETEARGAVGARRTLDRWLLQ